MCELLYYFFSCTLPMTHKNLKNTYDIILVKQYKMESLITGMCNLRINESIEKPVMINVCYLYQDWTKYLEKPKLKKRKCGDDIENKPKVSRQCCTK